MDVLCLNIQITCSKCRCLEMIQKKARDDPKITEFKYNTLEENDRMQELTMLLFERRTLKYYTIRNNYTRNP
jgi:hypothetical protein